MSKPRHRQLEEGILADLDARTHLNSGALAAKHDGSDKEHVFEIKTTQAKSYILTQEYWKSLTKIALQRLREPVLILAFDDGKSKEDRLDKVVMIDYEYFRSLTEKG